MKTKNTNQRSKTVQINPQLSLTSFTPKVSPQLFLPSPVKNHQPINNYFLSQSSKLDRYVGNFSTRASGKINCVSPTNQLLKQKTQIQPMDGVVKEKLKNLNYRQKLINIEHLIRNSRQLCQQYGYFYITCAMLFYDPFNEIKLSVWVHPDTRMKKCLHPINKKTQYEKQVEFIINLKLILKQFFPTIYLGNGRTFITLLIHITELRAQLMAISKKHHQQQFFSSTIPTQKNPNIRGCASNELLTKKYFAQQKVIRQEAQDDEKQENLYKRQSKTIKKQKIQEVPQNPTKLDNLAKILKDEQENEGRPVTPGLNSTQIEQDFNNLFCSNDFLGGYYGTDKKSQATTKKSMMQRVADEFNELF